MQRLVRRPRSARDSLDALRMVCSVCVCVCVAFLFFLFFSFSFSFTFSFSFSFSFSFLFLLFLNLVLYSRCWMCGARCCCWSTKSIPSLIANGCGRMPLIVFCGGDCDCFCWNWSFTLATFASLTLFHLYFPSHFFLLLNLLFAYYCSFLTRLLLQWCGRNCICTRLPQRRKRPSGSARHATLW